jgi:CBS-domain-containing membrane protein
MILSHGITRDYAQIQKRDRGRNSADLLFAVPHGQLSQTRTVFDGHRVFTAIGVTCAELISPTLLAAAYAVGM